MTQPISPAQAMDFFLSQFYNLKRCRQTNRDHLVDLVSCFKQTQEQNIAGYHRYIMTL